MKLITYTAIFVPEKDKDFPDSYTVTIPALPGCLSCGDSLTEARYNIREALELYLSTLLDEELPIPKNKKVRVPRGAVVEDITVAIGFDISAGWSTTPGQLSAYA